MGYASLSGRARTSSRSPQAFAVCDRCSKWYNHANLSWQFDWAGASLINKRILVCRSCTDVPQNQLRAIVIPADPLPVKNPRTEPYAYDETNTRVVSQAPTIDPNTGLAVPGLAPVLQTQDGQDFTTQPIGNPVGLDGNAVMPVQEGQIYARVLPVVSISSIGTDIITVTCSSAHGLSTNDQVSVQGLTNGNAAGMYSVTVTTATAFNYQINKVLPAQSLITGTSRVITAIVGLPYGYAKIPLTGT